MSRRLPRPTNVPEGHSPLINKLWSFYVAANGPATRTIATVIEGLDDDQRNGTANHETVRRTLTAISLPQWQTVEVIFLALCQIADVDPDDEDDGDQWESPRPHRERLQEYWRLAMYGRQDDLPRTRDEKAKQEAAEQRRRTTVADDPWGSAPPPRSSVADEPPF